MKLSSNSRIFILGPPNSDKLFDLSWKETLVISQNEKDLNFSLCRPNQTLIALALNYQLDNITAIKGIRLFREKRPVTPIFLIGEREEMLDKKQQDLTIDGYLNPQMEIKDFLTSWENSKHQHYAKVQQDTGDQDHLNQLSNKTDEKFFPIQADCILLAQRSFFDVYIRLKKNKYLKLVNKGDPIPKQQIESYLKKGMTEFYLLKEQQTKFLFYCDHITEKLIQRHDIGLPTKTNHVLNLGDQVLQYFSQNGVDPAGIQFAKNFLSRGVTIVGQLRKNQDQQIANLLDDILKYQHSTVITIFTALLAKKMGFSTEEKINVISLASLLHDIGLLKLSDIKDKKVDQLTAEEMVLYKTHPVLGGEILSGINGVSEVIIQGVKQHHERKDKSGFPGAIPGHSITFVAEIIGICDEFLYCLERDEESSAENFRSNFIFHNKKKFSNNIFDSFSSVFLGNHILKLPKNTSGLG